MGSPSENWIWEDLNVVGQPCRAHLKKVLLGVIMKLSGRISGHYTV